jgi:hypothetical protein
VVLRLDAIAFQPGTALELLLTDFRDVRRPNDITIGPDLGGTWHQASNVRGDRRRRAFMLTTLPADVLVDSDARPLA